MSCRIPSCTREPKEARYIMCYGHWNLVPLVLQKTIWRLWNNGDPLPGHAEACASAVQQVIDKLDEGVLDPATSWPNRTRRATP